MVQVNGNFQWEISQWGDDPALCKYIFVTIEIRETLYIDEEKIIRLPKNAVHTAQVLYELLLYMILTKQINSF